MGIVSVLSGRNYITVSRPAAKRFGLVSAALLGELCCRQDQHGAGFFASEEKLAESLSVSKHIIRKAMEPLKESGVLSVELRGLPRQNHYTIDEAKLLKALEIGNSPRNEELTVQQAVKTVDCWQSKNCTAGSAKNTPHINNETNNDTNNDKESAQQRTQRHKHGEYSNVLLTDEELSKIQAEYPDWQQRIERLSEYIASSGKRYKSHYATIRAWARKDGNVSKAKPEAKRVDFDRYFKKPFEECQPWEIAPEGMSIREAFNTPGIFCMADGTQLPGSINEFREWEKKGLV